MGHGELRELVGAKWTIELLELLETEEELNYTDIAERIPTSSDVVSDRLSLLVECGFVHRDERSAKDVRYVITDAGMEFLRRIKAVESLLDAYSG